MKNDGKQQKSGKDDENFDGKDEITYENPELESSSKWSLRFLKKYISKKYTKQKTVSIFEGCKDVIIKTLMSTEPPIVSDL